MEIKTERLILRDFKPEDIHFYIDLETHYDCIEYESETVLSEESIIQNFNQIIELQVTNPRDKYSFIIISIETNEPVGRVVLWKIDDSIREWEIGWFIHPNYWKNGYASEAAKTMIQFAFEELNVHRIQALCHEHNQRSERVMINIGMQKEGILRSVRYLNHHWAGSLIYSILDTDHKKR